MPTPEDIETVEESNTQSEELALAEVPTDQNAPVYPVTLKRIDRTVLYNATFLGCDERNYYGDSLPDQLDVIWKYRLGKGESFSTPERGVEEWSGAGWTGQPLLIEENGELVLFQGAFDHTLKKIDAVSGSLIWEYRFDDILKGTGTISAGANGLMILQGSRLGLGNSINTKKIYSFRSIRVEDGEEVWRFNVRPTLSYSRDVDGSALVFDDTVYIGLENGIFTVLEGDKVDGGEPEILEEHFLYTDEDFVRHGGNLVTESSPARLGDHLYITSGSGHVYGYNLRTRSIDWDLYLGADMDGSPVVTYDSCLIVTVEQQFIKGKGGAMKIDPSRAPEESVVWYFPTLPRNFADWKGGIIGSAAVNDRYRYSEDPMLAAFMGIDGILYVVEHDSITDNLTQGPDGKTVYPMPRLVDQKEVGPSISTPVFSGDRLLAASYLGIELFRVSQNGLESLQRRQGGFEATPFFHRGQVFVASRDGYLYCLGDTTKRVDRTVPEYPEADLLTHEINEPGNELEDAAGITQSSPEIKPEREPSITETAEPEPSALQEGRYQLIVGAFSVSENAERMKTGCIDKGIETRIEVFNGMHYVIVGQNGSGDFTELKRKLEAKGLKNLWVRRN